eukprot:708999-Prymnesium_polylepis.1
MRSSHVATVTLAFWAAPGALAQGGYDMSHVFAQYRDCASCVGAGYGWCTGRRKCGGFANKVCGAGDRYFAELPAPTLPTQPPAASSAGKKKKKRPAPSRPPSQPPPSGGGVDMSATFA